MGRSTTPIPPLPAGWMRCGAYTSGLTAHPRGAMKRNSGFVAVTNTIATKAERTPPPLFLGVFALLFTASVAATIYFCRSMSGGMDMPGGWTMSMAWMRMPGQSWPAAAAMFLGMWVVMMVAMMLPSLVLMLRHYRQAVTGASDIRLGGLTTLVGVGYFFVWAVFGAV